MRKSKNIFFNIAVHIGIIALILHIHIMTSCLPCNDPIMLLFFYTFSLLGIVIHPTLFNNKTAEKCLWYLLCYTSFVIPYIHLAVFYHGLLGFIAVICTMLLMNLLVNCNASAKYFPNTEHINLMVSRNIKFICYIGGLSEVSFLFYSQFATINEELALLYGIIELSIVLFWLIYNVVYFHKKYFILVIFLGLAILNLMPQYLDYSFIDIAIILFPVLGLVAIFIKEEKKPRLNFSKDEWLQTIIVAALLILSVLNISLCISGKFPIMFAALQLASYAVAAFFLIRDYSKKCKHNLNMESLIARGIYAVFFIFEIVSTKIETDPGTEVIRHIQWSSMFVLFAFIVVVLSKLWFKKYNCIKSALFVFLGGVALNVAIVYNQDLANYATWLPQVLQKHLVMASCYGAAIWIIPKLMRLRISQYNTPTTINEETLCEEEKQ